MNSIFLSFLTYYQDLFWNNNENLSGIIKVIFDMCIAKTIVEIM